MSSIEKALMNYFQMNSTTALYEHLKSSFTALDFDLLQVKLKFSRHALEQFITSFIKAQQTERCQLQTQEKEDLFLYIACLLKLKLFTFPETVEFFIPRSLQRFAPQTLRQSFYNFKKNKKMSQLQVHLNYNFVDLQQLFQVNPETQKRQFELFFDHWVEYLQGNDSVLESVCPEVFKILSGEIQVQIPTAIQQLNEETKVTKNMRIYELEQYINAALQRRVLCAKNFDTTPPRQREIRRDQRQLLFNAPFQMQKSQLNSVFGTPPVVQYADNAAYAPQDKAQHTPPREFPQNQSNFAPYAQGVRMFQPTAVPAVPASLALNFAEFAGGSLSARNAQNQNQFQAALPHTDQVAQIFNQASQMRIPNPPPINLQAYTHSANYSTMADIQSLSLLNNSTLSNNSLLQNDFRSVINENAQMQRTEESDAQQNLVHALGGMEEVSMCLMQLGMHERSESKQ